MQSGLNLLNPLQGKIRTSFMIKDGSASLPLFMGLLRVLEVDLIGGLGSEATVAYSGKDIPPHSL